MYIRLGGTKHIIYTKGRLILPCILVFLNVLFLSEAGFAQTQSDSLSSYQLRYPIRENNYPFSTSGIVSPMLLRPPSNVTQTIVYDPVTKRYVFSEKVGELNYRTPTSMSLDEYRLYYAKKTEMDYWREKSFEESGSGPSFMKNLRLNNQAVEKVFGSDVISITPQGSAELIFGYNISKYDNPLLPVSNRRNGSFIFKEKIMMNVTGSIGDKMEVGLSYNTEATFDFENKTKLEYAGKEDEIIRKIEAGDVSFTLPGTLITGSQSLFGLKTELQFGRLTVTGVVSHQRGESSSINVQGGAQLTEYEIDVSNYDVNRHFFLSHFFRDNYTNWMENLPQIESQVQIQQIDVWVVNKQNNFSDAKNIAAFMDLGEGYGPDGEPNFYATDVIFAQRDLNKPTDNTRNNLYRGLLRNEADLRDINTSENAIQAFAGDEFAGGRDYDMVGSARPLSEREYTVNRELGYISLNSPLRNDEVLAVAYTYTYRGKVYQVGELATEIDGSDVVVTKLLKGRTTSPKFTSWDLMMKNVYAIGAYQVNRDGFVLHVLYRDDKTGVPVNYLSEKDTAFISSNVQEQPLLKVLELDNLDSRNEQNPDGQFDYIEGITINSRNGRIYFPVLEPFGTYLYKQITDDSNDPLKMRTADKYVYQELYDSTQTKAEQISEKNKFVLMGQYQSASSSDIQLNAMNIPRGSVIVTAGGTPLTEGADYTVDYTLGRVKIINSGLLESGTPIKISLESNSLFNIQTKTLLGTHLDYRFSENFNIGATIMNLTERPLTEKVNMGDEPISNTIWGLNTSYRTESQLLTTIVDAIPLIETKEPSSISIEAEFAQLIPGQSKTIGKNGVAYIDDFEAAQTKIDMKSFLNWNLASPPRGNIFFNSDEDSLPSGFGRSRLAWYVIDPLFYSNSGLNPGGTAIDEDLQSHYARRIEEREIFPEKDNEIPGQNYLSILNMAYYPEERGPYNFDMNMEPEGNLENPGERWGGMMRDISNSDFETANIEFIEFWVMDPFIENPDHEGGDLYIQLGEISEDILRDNRKSFEGGLPRGVDDSTTLVDETVWGIVPSRQAFTNTFVPEARQQQDIGLDGLSDDAELNWPHYQPFKTFVENNLGQEISEEVLADLSGDNYEYYLSDNHDANNHGIFERYKKFNNLENNSPTAEDSDDEFSSANRNTPDIEDLNEDNTLNTIETYFQYHIEMTRDQLSQVGRNYIVDRVERQGIVNGEGQPVVWLQFKIPLGDWESKLGDIEDFRSIRFMRMMMTGFEEQAVLRFATLDLVRGEWRRYNLDISETAPIITQQRGGTSFEVSAVNIEENASKDPVNYVLPPGVDRVTDPSNPQLAQLNEQSILLNVDNLADADARSVFKNVQLDLRQYKKMQMFIHAEALPGREGELEDKDISAFIRIGSDYQNNYYEYEIPLEITPPGKYPDQSKDVWPDANNIILDLEDFVELKKKRNKEADNDPLNFSSQSVYMKLDEKNERNESCIIKVKGNPNLSNVRQIMLGIRNPGDASSMERENDGESKSAEVWFNELRLTDFNDRGGWAANGRVQAQLADFGVLNVAGSTSKPGFGSIDQKVNERSMEEVNQYDISSNLELGKFFPEKAQVSIPFYVAGSKTIINPEYFPKDPDIKFEDVLKEADSKAEKDSLKKISQDYTSRKSINITNMRWNKKFKKWDIFSPGNIVGSIGYADTKTRNYNVEYNNLWKYTASLNYVFNTRPKNIQPFRKSQTLRKPAYRIIRDFNFNPYPSRFTFGTSFDRNYQEIKVRDISDDVELLFEPTVNKDFNWDRKYELRWNLTRGLRMDYSATNNARIDEPGGQTDLFKDNNKNVWKDSVWTSILQGGRNMNFSQKFNVSYTVPINKIPIFNWISLNTSYGSTFSWVRGVEPPMGREPQGHTMKNSNTIKINSNLTLRSLYNKIGYFKRLDAKYSGRGRKPEEDIRYKTVEYEKRTFFKKDQPKNIFHKLKTDDIEVKVLDANGQEVEVKTTVINENKISITAPEDMTRVTVYVTGKIPKGENPFVFLGENTIRLLLGFKSVNASWSRTVGTVLPGYLPETNYLGISTSQDYYGAPGFGFAFGQQNNELIYDAIDDNWLTVDSLFSKPAEFTHNEQFNFRTTFEPFKGFRIDLNMMRNYSEFSEQLYFHDSEDMSLANYGNYFVDNSYKGGNFSISIITITTAFEKPTGGNSYESKAFNNLREYRKTISARRYNDLTSTNHLYPPSLRHPYNDGYYYGYGPTSQDVLVPAFLSAYTGRDPNKITFTNFFWNMLPNWRITFDGLSKIKFFQKFLKNITLSHSYKSTYTVGSFGTNLSFYENLGEGFFTDEELEGFRGLVRDNQMNFVPEFQYSSVSINEQINPLINIDMTWHNSLITKFEIGRSRLISLSLNNNQVNETRNKDYTFGAGYRFKEVPITINQKAIKSDLNVRFDFSIRDNYTIIRFLEVVEEEEEDNRITTGGKQFRISFTADYVFSENFNIQFYFDREVNTPFTSETFPRAETNVGFSLRLSL